MVTVLEIESAEAENKSLLLLATNRAGYSNLCQLVTRYQLDEQPLSLEQLNAHRQGLIALYAPQKTDLATEYIAHLKEIFGDALYLEARHFPASNSGNLRSVVALRRALGLPMAAANQVHFLRPEEHLHHRVLNAIRTGSLLTKVAPPYIVNDEAYFKSGD